ncbi:MAG: Gfo/Idh/MocA family oxidoreductase [Planctomycetota bacterium]
MSSKNVSTNSNSKRTDRRNFLKTGSAVAAAGAVAGSLATPDLSIARSAYAGGSETVKIGLIGCGGRGTGAAEQAMNTTSSNVELTCMADVFEDRLRGSHNRNSNMESIGGKVRVNDDAMHIGYDAYKRVLDSDVDLVILTTPPGFRPLHFEAAIDAGKHVFMEKPVAVDAPGVRRVLKTGELAREKNLAVAVGLQRRHEPWYRDTIQQLKDGIIGDLLVSRVYWNGDGVWMKNRQEGWTELEYQMRNWYYFNWICGDHIVEQHIHNLDVINWLMDDYPSVAQGQGGRQVRTGPDSGQIFDHHIVEYTYPNGHRMISQCRHQPSTWRSVSEHVHGSKGYASISSGRIYDLNGNEIYKAERDRRAPGGHQQEHHDLFADLANGIIPNEAEYGAKSTMTSIFGRLATYTGMELKWEDAINSDVSLCDVDVLTGMDNTPPLEPDENGKYWVPTPGAEWDKGEVIDWNPRGR